MPVLLLSVSIVHSVRVPRAGLTSHGKEEGIEMWRKERTVGESGNILYILEMVDRGGEVEDSWRGKGGDKPCEMMRDGKWP